MGWNDHVDWQMIGDFELLVDNDEVQSFDDGDIEHMRKIVETVASGFELERSDRIIYDSLIAPLWGKIEDIHREAYMDYLMAKDD
jgi:hypothetical protein